LFYLWGAEKEIKEVIMSDTEKPAYRLLTGEDTHDFCVRVSTALAEGYVLYGSPSCTFDPKANRMLVSQAVIKPAFSPQTSR
jgi:hypothetical protein